MQLSINYLELYALTVGIFCWLRNYKNCKIVIYCDNQSVMHMVNNTTSSCPNCMVLIRLLTLEMMYCNVKLNVKYVSSADNIFADHLSRLRYKDFQTEARKKGKKFESKCMTIPEQLDDITPLILVNPSLQDRRSTKTVRRKRKATVAVNQILQKSRRLN